MSQAATLFALDDFAPLTVKSIRCAACIGTGKTLMRETCPRCDGDGRLGSSIWRGSSYLTSITTKTTKHEIRRQSDAV